MTRFRTIVTMLFCLNSNQVIGNIVSQYIYEDSIRLLKAQELLSLHRYDSAARHLHLLLYNSKTKASANHWLGILHASTGNLDSAIGYFKNAISCWIAAGDLRGTTSSELNLAIVYKNKGQYSNALDHSLRVISSLEKLPPGRELASAYNNTALIYDQTKDFNNALEYHRQSLRVRESLNEPSLVSQSLNNIGNTFLAINQPDSAISYFTASLKIKRERNEYPAAVLNNIGEVQFKLGNLESARRALNESLLLKREKNDKTGQAVTLKNLGQLEMASQQWFRAEKFLDDAEALAREVKALEYIRQILELKSELYDKLDNPRLSLRYTRELLEIKDSLLNKEKAAIISEMQMRFETEKKEQQILLMQQEGQLQSANIRQKNILIIILVVGIVLAITIVLLIWLNARNVRRGKQRVEILMHELQHRVRNNLQLLAGIFTLQTRYLTDASAIALAKGSEGRINAIAIAHRELSASGKNNRIAMANYVRELVDALTNAFSPDTKNLQTDLQLEELELDVEKAMPLGLIVNELVTNAFKYAFPGTSHPKLQVILKMENIQSLLLRVSDNGHHVKDVAYYETSSSFGLNMVRTLVRELHGKLEIRLQGGTHFFLHIPIAA